MLPNTLYTLTVPDLLPLSWYTEAVKLLDIHERQRYKRYKQPRKNIFLLGRWLLKKTLADQLGCQASSVIINIKKNGKPHIKQPRTARNLHISLTHSGNMIACGISHQSHGIDVENIDRAPHNIKKVAKLINPIVYQHVKQLSKQTKIPTSTLFTVFWTYLETQVKLKGSTIYQEKGCFFQQSRVCPHDLTARTASMLFFNQKVLNYILSYSCYSKKHTIPITFVKVKRSGKSVIFVAE